MSRVASISLVSLFAGALGLLACSTAAGPSSDNGPGASAVDEANLTGAAAAAGASDAGPPPACYVAASAPTACTAPSLTPASSACDDAHISAFINACLVSQPAADGGPDACAQWLAGPGASACGGCLKAWSRNDSAGAPAGGDTAACYYAQTPTCNTDLKCYFDCVDATCGTCSTAADFKSCQAAANAGACGAKLAAASSCAHTAPALSACSAATVAKATAFYHGACVASGHWLLPDGGAP